MMPAPILASAGSPVNVLKNQPPPASNPPRTTRTVPPMSKSFVTVLPFPPVRLCLISRSCIMSRPELPNTGAAATRHLHAPIVFSGHRWPDEIRVSSSPGLSAVSRHERGPLSPSALRRWETEGLSMGNVFERRVRRVRARRSPGRCSRIRSNRRWCRPAPSSLGAVPAQRRPVVAVCRCPRSANHRSWSWP